MSGISQSYIQVSTILTIVLPAIVLVFGSMTTFIWWIIRSNIREFELRQDKKYNELKRAVEKRDQELKSDARRDTVKIWETISKIQHDYMSEEKHGLVCANLELKMRNIFTECFNNLKDDLFAKIRKLEGVKEKHDTGRVVADG